MESIRLSFFVEGEPACKGSMRAMASKSTGRPIMLHQDKRLKAWTEAIQAAALNEEKKHSGQWWPLAGEVSIRRLEFRFAKPKKPAHRWPRKDLDKLVRAVLDALTGVVYVDDSQVWGLDGVRKRYACGDEKPGVLVEMEGEVE